MASFLDLPVELVLLVVSHIPGAPIPCHSVQDIQRAKSQTLQALSHTCRSLRSLLSLGIGCSDIQRDLEICFPFPPQDIEDLSGERFERQMAQWEKKNAEEVLRQRKALQEADKSVGGRVR